MKCRQMLSLVAGLSLVVNLTLVSIPLAEAHHAINPTNWAQIELKGTIVFVSWDGAHVMYRLEAENDQRVMQTWEILGASPKILTSRHINKSTFKKGEQIKVSGHIDPYSKIIAPDFFTAGDGHQYEMGFYPQPMLPKQVAPAK